MSEGWIPGSGCSRHAGGSRSYIEHTNVLRIEKGREPNAYEIFLRTHMKNDGTYVHEKARKIGEDVKACIEALEEARGQGSADVTQIFLELSTMNKQGIFGLGSQACLYTTTSALQIDEDTLRRQVSEQVNVQMATLQEQLDKERAQMHAQMEEERAQMHAQMEEGRLERARLHEQRDKDRQDYSQLQSQVQEMARMMMVIRRQGQTPP